MIEMNKPMEMSKLTVSIVALERESTVITLNHRPLTVYFQE